MYKTSDFNYFLPQDLIAQTPIEPRDSSRLLVYSKEVDGIEHKHFFEIENYLKSGDVLVVNNTKVLPARIFGQNQNGATIEILLLERVAKDVWEVLVKPGRKVKDGATIFISQNLSAKILSKTASGGRMIEFTYNGVFEDILNEVGTMPLPPYIKEKLSDSSRYQTIYCKNQGSSAAPTAGLHFTKELLNKLEQKGVIIAEVTLNVGLGTFRPVKVQNLNEHSMHSELYSIDEKCANTINLAKKEGRRIIAVGTTSVRTLESAADENGLISHGSRQTDIFIYPPYKFKCIDAIITNFHLPESTLIMLISAFIGREKTLSLYEEAVKQKYRFFSFGDAMFLY